MYNNEIDEEKQKFIEERREEMKINNIVSGVSLSYDICSGFIQMQNIIQKIMVA